MEESHDQAADVKALVGSSLMQRYRVESRIATGGMGVVFRGLDERLHRPVCVKVLHAVDPSRPEYATVLQHFIQEAFTLSRLTHPNTLRIYDFGYLDDQRRLGPFFVTEFADGGTLANVVEDRGELAAAEVLRILEPIVGALSEAHDAGIVHRDIKPSNILFCMAGVGLIPKLCDFSIAKTTGDFPNRAQDTNTQIPLYSVSWAAPEQLTFEASPCPASDVFALALTTAYMLSGFEVYPAGDLMHAFALRAKGEAFRRARFEEFLRTPSVREVLGRATAERPEDRYIDVESFFDALRDAFEDDGRDLELSSSDLSVVSALPGTPVPVEDEDLDTRMLRGIEAQAEVLPLHVVPPAPQPEVHPQQPQPPHVVHDPTIVLDSLEREHVSLGGRWARLVENSTSALTLTAIDGGEHPKVRVTAMRVDGLRVHVKGLNCFVRLRGGRVSSGVDVKQDTSVELVSVRQTVAASFDLIIGQPRGGYIVCGLRGLSLAIPQSLASWVIVLDTGPAGELVVLHARPNS